MSTTTVQPPAQQAEFEPDEVDRVDLAKVPAGALRIDPEQQFWSLEQRAVLRAMGVDRRASNAELAAFLHVCQAYQLDPFLKQVYLIAEDDGGRLRFVPHTGINGFRAIARRAADKAGIDYGYEDPVFFDGAGRSVSVWLWQMPPVAVRFCVVRGGHRFPVVARTAAYMPVSPNGDPLGMWRKMPDHMILKCAEALALRAAFPKDLGGLYVVEELGLTGGAESPLGAEVVADAKRTADTGSGSSPRRVRAQATSTPSPPAPQAAPPVISAADASVGPAAFTPSPAEAAPPSPSTPEPGPDERVTDDRLHAVLDMLAECQVTTVEQVLVTVQLLTGKRLTHIRQMTNRMADWLTTVLTPIAAGKTPQTDLQELLRRRLAETMQAQTKEVAAA